MPSRPHPVVEDALLHNVPVFPLDTLVSEARHVIEHRKDWESVNYIYLTNKKDALVCTLSIKELLNASTHVTMASLCKEKKPVAVGPHTTQERAAILAIHHGIKAIPVVGRGGKLLGVFGTDEILNILQHAGIDDAIRYQGIHVEHRGLLDMLHGRVTVLLKRRVPWLLVGLAGGFLSALVVGRYEGSLREVIELSFFMPAVAYMGAAVGMQTQALYLRAITIGEVRVGKFLAKEFLMDVILGALMGGLAFVAVSFLFVEQVVALIVGLGMFATISVSGLVAVGIATLLATREGGDPALGSGPFTTIVQDLVSVSVYLGVATLILSL
jgi:magnesium transporter